MAKKKATKAAASGGGPRAVARACVEISDDGCKGRYKPGQVVEGDAAAMLLERYPVYFAVTDPQPATPNPQTEEV